MREKRARDGFGRGLSEEADAVLRAQVIGHHDARGVLDPNRDPQVGFRGEFLGRERERERDAGLAVRAVRARNAIHVYAVRAPRGSLGKAGLRPAREPKAGRPSECGRRSRTFFRPTGARAENGRGRRGEWGT